MEKQKDYEFKGIEICRNCQGSGTVDPGKEWADAFLGRFSKRASGQCPVCEGSGRVVKTRNISIKITPFKE